MISYKDSGVDIEEGYKTVQSIKKHVEKTFIPGVLNHIGSFAGMFEMGKYNNPVLVSGTDGVGTKLDIAFRTKKYSTVGIDCVAMCVNDILCHGAKPLFFLDYLACGKLKAELAEDLVKGVADGCLQAGCALIGGETAEMPGFYRDGEYDLAGFAVGVVEKDRIIDGAKIKEGDILIGIESSGIHSNGYSLVRKLIPNLEEKYLNESFGDILLTPTQIYVKPVLNLIDKYEIKGMAHITGGGFYENIPRMFKKDFTAVIDKKSFKAHPIFEYIKSKGIDEKHMYNTFNMGIGFVLCIDAENAETVIGELKVYGLKAYNIGYVEAGGAGVCIR